MLPRGEAAEPRVVGLGFPFETQPELAARIAGPDRAALRDAFRRAYAALPESVRERKISTLDAIER